MLKFFKRIVGIANRRHSTRVQLLAALEHNAELAEQNYRLRAEQTGLWAANKELIAENAQLREMLSSQIRETERAVVQGLKIAGENDSLRQKSSRLERLWEESHIANIYDRAKTEEARRILAQSLGCLSSDHNIRTLAVFVAEKLAVSPCKCDICDNSSA